MKEWGEETMEYDAGGEHILAVAHIEMSQIKEDRNSSGDETGRYDVQNLC